MDHSPAGRERKSTRELQQSTVTSPLIAPSSKSGVRVLYSLRGPECYSIHYQGRKACPVVEAVCLKQSLFALPLSRRWVWLERGAPVVFSLWPPVSYGSSSFFSPLYARAWARASPPIHGLGKQCRHTLV